MGACDAKLAVVTDTSGDHLECPQERLVDHLSCTLPLFKTGWAPGSRLSQQFVGREGSFPGEQRKKTERTLQGEAFQCIDRSTRSLLRGTIEALSVLCLSYYH